MSVQFETWSVERQYSQPSSVVFAAWADEATKKRWFDLSTPAGVYSSDFRVGGNETLRNAAGESPAYAYDGVYLDIVPESRIVISYTVTRTRRRVSASLLTAVFTPESAGARLEVTEQGVYLDDLDSPSFRRDGIFQQLDALGRALN